MRPIDLAALPLFAAIADLLARCASSELPDCADLDRWMAEANPPQWPGADARPRFVLPDERRIRYEERVYARAEIVTRPGSWHDFFNALVWIRFPQTKAALNAAHRRHMAGADARAGRGPVRDAVTQFDESGVVVASADASLIDLLDGRRWKELFWRRRAAVVADMRFVVFGHGLYDALRAPFYRICGRAATVVLEPSIVRGEIRALCAAIDAVLAARFAADTYSRPRDLLALPLLGIPGVTPENASPAYYEDRLQFRGNFPGSDHGFIPQ